LLRPAFSREVYIGFIYFFILTAARGTEPDELVWRNSGVFFSLLHIITIYIYVYWTFVSCVILQSSIFALRVYDNVIRFYIHRYIMYDVRKVLAYNNSTYRVRRAVCPVRNYEQVLNYRQPNERRYSDKTISYNIIPKKFPFIN